MRKTSAVVTTAMLVLSLILISGCESGLNPDVSTVKMEVKATTVNSTLNSTARVKNSGLVFHEVLAGLTELEFETFEENESEDRDGENDEEEIEFKGTFIADLINGTITPDLGVAELAPGLYEEIEMDFGPILDEHNSVFISFDLPRDGSDPVRVEFSSKEEFEFELEDEVNGYQIDAGALNTFLVLLNLDALFNEIDFSTADVDSDGVIRINRDSNIDLAEQIEIKFNDSFETEDEDENEELDDEDNN